MSRESLATHQRRRRMCEGLLLGVMVRTPRRAPTDLQHAPPMEHSAGSGRVPDQGDFMASLMGDPTWRLHRGHSVLSCWSPKEGKMRTRIDLVHQGETRRNSTWMRGEVRPPDPSGASLITSHAPALHVHVPAQRGTSRVSVDRHLLAHIELHRSMTPAMTTLGKTLLSPG